MYFYPRPPGGGRPAAEAATAKVEKISIHALRVEGDVGLIKRSHNVEISIHALRVEGDFVCYPSCIRFNISIHALRVEGDASGSAGRSYVSRFLSTPSGWRATKELIRAKLEQIISIHALRVEGDGQDVRALADIIIFLSTPSGWRATWDAGRLQQGKNHFYPRPPGGGRPVSAGTEGIDPAISIHALRVEGDYR